MVYASVFGTKQKEETYGKIAAAWRDCPVGERIEIVQPNALGGKTLEKTLKKHFSTLQADSRNHCRIITITKNDNTPPIIEEWLAYTRLSMVEGTGFYSMPGLFCWDRIDKGSQMLLESLGEVKGVGADFGCGYGYLTRHVLERFEKISSLYALDIDDRAVDAVTENISDPRMLPRVADCTKAVPNLSALDFIVSNPPFHNQGGEDRTMGQKFIETAAHHLKRSGHLWIVANKHMPYERVLEPLFRSVVRVVEKDGYKIIHAIK